MANKFVWSGATGANNGASWSDAYTTLMKDWGAEAGFTPATDFVYVRSVHSETVGTTLTITGSTAESTTARVRVISVVGAASGTDPGNLAAGAAVNTNAADADIVVNEGIYIYGVDFFSNDDILICNALVDHDINLETCRLELTGVSGSDTILCGNFTTAVGKRVELRDVIIDFGNADQGLTFRISEFKWVGGSVAFDVATLVKSLAAKANIEITGVDLSVLASSNLFLGSNVNADATLTFSRCLLATGATIVSGTIDVPGASVESYHCQIGTDADPAYQMEIQDSHGKVVTDTARYRDQATADGERATPISWDFDTTVGSVRGYPGHALEGPPITGWTDGDGTTTHTYRIYFASDTSIDNSQLWFELEGPNDAATNSMAVINTTRVAPRSAAGAYTTDASSTWTGTGVGTLQQMDITYTPDKPGPVTARVYMAVASDNIYVDPKVYIDP